MKATVKVESMFAGDERRGIRPIVMLGILAIVLASGALALQAQAVDGQDGRPQPPVRVPAPRDRDARHSQRSLSPGAIRPPIATRARDRFVVAAPAGVDPKMVVKAPSDLDAAMVFDRETGRRGQAPGGVRPSPGSSRGVRVPRIPLSLPGRGSRRDITPARKILK